MIITVIDTETTGLDKSKHEIIEIAMISYVISEDGEKYVLKKLNTKVKPRHIETASPKALEINHYNEEEWKDAPDISEVLPRVEEIINGSQVLIGQNLIFDLRYISNAFEDNGYKIPNYPAYIDTKAMADVLRKKKIITSSSMDNLCKHYDIQFSGDAHSAFTDCERTMKVWDKLLEDCGDYDFYSYSDPYEVRYDR
jgi:DNA polymerase III epsilon subunit family exonuclease